MNNEAETEALARFMRSATEEHWPAIADSWALVLARLNSGEAHHEELMQFATSIWTRAAIWGITNHEDVYRRLPRSNRDPIPDED